ncbi:putative ARD ARD' family Eukaryotic protein of unknown function (DUF953) [Trypanosoma vivax]|uniref:acireductone dioxygenase (Fe(2+)-requiring) n=1 Tax=Trypanosoma vivax (strain Y486) TaxID=1055687 RepID=G0UA33_TRYVY|nr:hypothetical protein TRVL_03130 [Trypanosoma vivax]KAH8619130.1 putative ARD ARD' family Eukaryotic protein of unknown function (DUF953) [Trypanosoma vivax]CCC52665.1 conserved hypothetical protein [Trypanosoma vivax Y486]
MSAAWLLNAQESDIANPCHCSPDVPVLEAQLEALGVFTRRIDAATLHERHPSDEEGRTCAQRLVWNLGYQAHETVVLSSESTEESQEHLNIDEQMRIVESGVIYVDVRDEQDRWLRVEGRMGDVIVIPLGIFHRVVAAASSGTTPVRVLRMQRKSVAFRPIPRSTTGLDEKLVAEAQSAREEHQFYVAHPPRDTIFGPANEVDNILVIAPRDFDATLEKVKASLKPTDVLVLLFKGTSHPKTHQSWCPPCVQIEPMVKRAVEAARQKRRVVYVQCILERSIYLGNPQYPYRVHPFVGIVSIPQLMVLRQDEDGLKELLRERTPGETCESWVANL